uniref:Uncharacterized protein n=1 Tax=Lepeophtheirus salmonis TaxID=72036 RepID=A0A0K2U6Y9_LEPSM
MSVAELRLPMFCSLDVENWLRRMELFFALRWICHTVVKYILMGSALRIMIKEIVDMMIDTSGLSSMQVKDEVEHLLDEEYLKDLRENLIKEALIRNTSKEQ